MAIADLQDFLDRKVEQYQNNEFIATDPIAIPRMFSNQQDIEIAGFFAATLAWGNRPAILKALHHLMELMDQAPWDFVMNGSDIDLQRLNKFVYRTFNGQDASYFTLCLRQICLQYDGLENAFADGAGGDVKTALALFRQRFFYDMDAGHAGKHVADVTKGASAKRLNMFLRWMVRQGPVDFGIWTSFSPADLYLPLDLHTGNVSRKLELLTRKQNDWKSVEEVTEKLLLLDSSDPIKYDFALFGLGIFEKF